jgi:tRNA(Ile2) C34 agmatinyltransferase TiaS
MDDPIDDMRQPQCPKCGTVLRDAARGYWCPSCELVYMPDVDMPR